MTRGNLNFIWQEWGKPPQTLYHYHNGDQYPKGLRDQFNIAMLLDNYTLKGFKVWIKENYDAEAVEIDHPCIFYDDAGFITDYSYVFDGDDIRVYNWDERLFKGNIDEFRAWLKEVE